MDRQAAGRAKYNINLLKDQTIQGAFTVTLRNRFQVLQELTTNDTDAHDLWKGTKEALTETCQEVLRPKKNQHKDWISVDTLQKIQARRLKKEAVNERRTRASKAAAQAEYTEAQKEVKRSVKKDKRDYIDSQAQEAVEAAYHVNMKDLYMTTKKLAGKYSRPERPVKDKQGQNITDSEQLLERWAEHFEELLNRPAPENPPDIAEAETDIDIDCDPPTYRRNHPRHQEDEEQQGSQPRWNSSRSPQGGRRDNS